MKNLKKALCLVLTIAMMMSLMIFTTSAADFTDTDEIVNTDAVNTMVALNIINGKGDGSYFDPTGIVTRAEMAKMICVALNGGKDPQLGTTAFSFTDTVGNWAAGYIEYCYNLGIVSGRGDGTFDPTGTVTGTEAAKMLLVAIGYDSASEGFTGATWANAVDVKANMKDLYDELDIVTSAGLTRDSAAQMVYNAINANKVTYEYKLITGADGNLATVGVAEDVTTTGKTTILEDKFDMDSNKGYLNKISYNEDTAKYTYTVTDNLFAAATATTGFTKTFSTTEDLTGLYGRYVKVLTKETSSGTKLYGMYDLSELAVTSTVGGIGTFSSNTFKADGTKYYSENAAATSVPVYEFSYGSDAATSYTLNAMTADKASAIVLVSDVDNSKVDYAVVFPATVAKVTYAGTDTLTTSAGAFDYDDDVIESGLAKGDYVKITLATEAFDDINHISKIDTVSGTVDGVDTANSKVLINGSWYTKTGSATFPLNAGDVYDIYVVGSYYYGEEVTSGSSITDIIYISSIDTTVSMNTQKAKAYFTDGTSSLITIDKIAWSAGALADNGTLTTVDATTVNLTSGTDEGLYTYKIKDGNYRVTPVGTNNLAGLKAYNTGTGFLNTGDKLTNCYIADDAVIFVNDKTDGIKIYTGATIKGWNSNYGTSYTALCKTVNGLATAKAVLLIDSASSGLPTSGDTKYGYITSTPYEILEGDDSYITYTIWTGSESITVKDENDNSYAKRNFITYTLSSGDSTGTYIDGTKITPDEVAVTGYDGTNVSLLKTDGSTSAYNLIDSDDTQFMYIKSATPEGIVGGEVAVAGQNSYGGYITNAFVVGSGSTVSLLVYDIDNEVYHSAGSAYSGYAVNVPAVTAISGMNATVSWKLDGVAVTAGTTAYADSGSTLVATVTSSGFSAITATVGNATLVGAGTGNAAAAITSGFAGANTTAATNTLTMPASTTGTTYSGVATFTWTTTATSYTPTLTYTAAT